MKKLIPALCMLLVAAALLGTSTFAWFSMNTEVEATGMSVKATASKNLLISDSADGTYGSTLNLNVTQTSLVPVSTSGTGAPAFYKLGALGYGMTAENYASGVNATFAAATEGTDYVHKVMYIKSIGAASSNLTATVNWNAESEKKDLDPALRVMIVVNGTRSYYAPVDGYSAWRGIVSVSDEAVMTACEANVGADAAIKAIPGVTYYDTADSSDPMDTQPEVGETVEGKYFMLPAGTPTFNTIDETVTNNGTVILTTVAKDTAVKIDVYVWYEGQDTNCTSAKAADLGASNLAITFNVDA